MNRFFSSFSKITFVILVFFILAYRFTHLYGHELNWDIFGYYLPLPATFIYNDASLNSTSWVEILNAKYHLTDTLYQISRTPTNEPMYFFFLGMAILYLPFFILGHCAAYFSGSPMDGFSEPYQYAMVLGAIIYGAIGLWYFRKFLLLYFTDNLVALLMLLLVFGTNYIQHNILKNLETVNFLFTGSAILFYYSQRIHHHFRLKYAIIISITLALMVLIKPSEVFFVLVPLMWGVNNTDTLKNRLAWIKMHRKKIAIAVSFTILIGSLQVGYFLYKTGRPIYDSYINYGVGIDWKNPHFYGTLFSYRKGWFLYTPLMLLMLFGWFVIYKKHRQHFWGWLLPFGIAFYIIASWTEYWYGAAFSNRPVIAWFPLLFLCMGLAIQYLWAKNTALKVVLSLFIPACVFLNCFQFWQLNNYILDPYRTTKEYYWKTFLQSKRNAEWEKLKLVNRSFSGNDQIEFPHLYDSVFLKLPYTQLKNEETEFSSSLLYSFDDLSSTDHVFVKINGAFTSDTIGKTVYISISIKGHKGPYGITYVPLISEGDTIRFEKMYLTPEMRSKEDSLQIYFWNPDKIKFEVRDLKMMKYTRDNDLK